MCRGLFYWFDRVVLGSLVSYLRYDRRFTNYNRGDVAGRKRKSREVRGGRRTFRPITPRQAIDGIAVAILFSSYIGLVLFFFFFPLSLFPLDDVVGELVERIWKWWLRFGTRFKVDL